MRWKTQIRLILENIEAEDNGEICMWKEYLQGIKYNISIKLQ